jgi:Zn-dependent peptidase ImmA (M78 family)/transcriptional regulator with XRE-family HTH domain
MTFNHVMLTVARESEGYTQIALAKASGMSQPHYSQIENGFKTPSPEQVEIFVRELGVPVEFFDRVGTVVPEGLVDFFHRRRRTLPAKPLQRAHAFANIVRLELSRLFVSVELEDVQGWPHLGGYEPEEAARALRAAWRLTPGPAPDLVGLIESTGSPVVRADLFHEKISAMTMPHIDGRHVVLLNERMPASHLRFAVAHEMGHLVLHTGDTTESIEEEADRFASEFLMPERDIRHQLAHLRFNDLGPLKHNWKVSFAALIHRAHDLSAISDRMYTTLSRESSHMNSQPWFRGRLTT